MKFEKIEAYNLGTEELETMNTHRVDVTIERDDETIVTEWFFHTTYRRGEWWDEDVEFDCAYVIDNATGGHLCSAELSDEETEAIKDYILLEVNIPD